MKFTKLLLTLIFTFLFIIESVPAQAFFEGWDATQDKTAVHDSYNAGASEAKLIKNKFPTEPLPSNGRIIDYTIENGQIKGVNGQRNLDFVVDSEGKLILGKKHHTLGNGQDVLGAGQLKLDGQGRIRRIDNLSGHYQPTVNEALNYPELFKQNGLNVKNAWLELYDIKVDSAGWVENYVKAVSKKIK